jgi:hypothetical protein
MPQMELILEGDGAWPDLAERMRRGRVIHLGNDAPPIQIAALAGGMASGQPSVMLRLELPDGRTVLAETSLRLFLLAAHALAGRYPQGDPSR